LRATKQALTTQYTIGIVSSMTGAELRVLRNGLGLTQAALAEKIGVSANTVARYERDELKIPEPVARLTKCLAAKPTVTRRKRG